MKPLTIDDTMPFGKFKGLPIKFMIENDYISGYINYLQWAINNWKNVEFSQEVKDRVNKESEATYILQREHDSTSPRKSRNSIGCDYNTQEIECFGIMGPFF